MNSKKSLTVYLMIFMLLVLPYFGSAAKTVYGVELVPIEQSSTFFEEESPKLFPEPGLNKIVDYYWGSGLDYAFNVEFNVRDIFPFTNNPTTRLEDLSRIQMILASIDMYFVTNDSFFLTNALIDASNLVLEVNSTYIAGDFGGVFYDFFAEDNLLLVIAYSRIAQALEVFGDPFTAAVYWDYANIAMDGIVDVFYHIPSGTLNATLFVDLPVGELKGGLNHQSAKSTGLFTMANYLLNDSSVYYTETKNALDTYMLEANDTVTLADFSTGYLFRSTNNSGAITDTQAGLQGNLYMNTAILQHSSYQSLYGSVALAGYYFNMADLCEQSLLEVFRSPDTGMFHSVYDLSSGVLKDTALTYGNALALSQITEFYRKKYDYTGSPQSLLEVLPVLEEMYQSLFVFPNFFEAGITLTGSVQYLDWWQQYRNPIIVNAQAITMLTKILPLDSMIVRDSEIRLFQDVSFNYYLKFAETKSIFGSSNSSSGIELKFDIFSQSNLNVSYMTYVPLQSTYLDGVKLNNIKNVSLNFFAEVGGEHDMSITITHSNFFILSFTQYFYIEKEIGISTDPPKIRAIQGYDDDVAFTIKCVDEQEISIKNAQVNITYNSRALTPILTNAAGEADISIPMDQLLTPDIILPPEESTFNVSFEITVGKLGYITAHLTKIVVITLNSYILSISPSPPQIKEGDDLILYLDVRTQIEATIWEKTAEIWVGETQINDSTYDEPRIQLEASISIAYSLIKEAMQTNSEGLAILHIKISTNILKSEDFFFDIHITPLKTLERIYSWIEEALQSTWVKVLTSLTVLWALLWKQFKLRILRTLRKCPNCGETGKSKYPYCRYCGEVLNPNKLPKAVSEPESEVETSAPKYDTGFQ